MIDYIDDYFDKPKKVTDMTVNGKCSGCGECCAALLPITDAEEEQIIRYMRKHNIKPHAKAAIFSVPSFDITCPFLDITKKKDRCMIYNVRPTICRSFICNKPERVKQKSFLNKVRYMKPVNMWDVAERGIGNGK